MDYLFSGSRFDSDGRAIIPKDLVSRWRYQIDTDYIDLPEEMKESDRKEADKILTIISEFMKKEKDKNEESNDRRQI